jgi:hypothetical protein
MNPPVDEREARIELAAAFRIAVQFDFHEGIRTTSRCWCPAHHGVLFRSRAEPLRLGLSSRLRTSAGDVQDASMEVPDAC